jgi:hypothetical protein
MSGNIFINYRRGDEPGFVQALLGRLEQVFPAERLFIDVDHIPPGEDFVHVLESKVSACDALLAVIGRGWLDATDESGYRRLDDPNDFVRVEIESALRQGKRVIPVLVHDARMPRADELPEPLRPLATRNAVRLTHERFRSDVQGLIAALQHNREKAAAGPTSQSVQQQKQRSTIAIAAAGFLLLAGATTLWFVYPRQGQTPNVAAAPPAPATTPPIAAAAPPAPAAASPPPAQARTALPQRPPAPDGDAAQCATYVRSGGNQRYCASTVLSPEFGNTYDVKNLFSADLSTAWVHGTHKSGVGEWIVVEFDGYSTIRSITIRNGYQKSQDIFGKNSRVRELRLLFSQGQSKVIALADRDGAQTFTLDLPINAYWMQFVIDGVYAGSKYPDTAIAKLFVTSDSAQ